MFRVTTTGANAEVGTDFGVAHRVSAHGLGRFGDNAVATICSGKVTRGVPTDVGEMNIAQLPGLLAGRESLGGSVPFACAMTGAGWLSPGRESPRRRCGVDAAISGVC
ncbi:hypothetical protein GCM10023318_28640 [Nocardia callitridis]|uniref:Uncharacterized protein n=1 Tax=Nocardia callitridis TaxID=648753 RepID=A0ABP9KBT1_9NOCA